MMPPEPTIDSAPPMPGGDFAPLDACERGVVEIFVSVADVLGFARSLGEIYGLAYISERPIHLAEVCERLQMSKGSASQGLRTLRDLGALKTVEVAGDRRDFFAPEIKIRVLLHRLLAERFRPHLDRSATTVSGLQRELAAADMPAVTRKFRADRLLLLSAWRKRVSLFLPLIQRLLR